MRKILAVSLVTLSVVGSAMGGVVAVHADEVENKASNGNVGFKTPEDGGLKLLEVADLNFGDNEISDADQVYKTISSTKSSVKDIRGTETGWELRVSQDKQFMNKDNELTNAQITFDAPKLDEGSTAIANVKSKVSLTPNGDSVVIMDANEGEGNGTAIENLDEGATSLSVPGETLKVVGQYETTLNWTLMDGVSNK